jgi:lytic murein transglycosylase
MFAVAIGCVRLRAICTGEYMGGIEHRCISWWLAVRAGLAGVVVLCCIVSFGPARATSPGEFSQFLQSLWPEAQTLGVSRATFDRELSGLAPDLKLPDLVRPGRTGTSGGGQAEFTKTPLEYLNPSYLMKLAVQGRALKTQHAAALAQIERELGVDRHIVLAIWGRETSYGNYKLPHDAIAVLATQAFMGRRKDVFRRELLFGLKMLDDRVITRAQFRSSWAGAVGLTQFLPSEYFTLAYDLDQDGKKDIWGSVPDALASAANQLKQKGWVSGQPWGFEVKLPAGPSCLFEGIPNTRKVADWLKLGVQRAGGRAIPKDLEATDAFILTPGGSYGPAFMVFENFMVLKRYNFADLYAVFVGHLADRMAGGPDFVVPWTTPKMLATSELEDIQARLQAVGWPIEKVDGKAGMNTRNLIGQYQQTASLPVDCWPSEPLLRHVRGAAIAKPTAKSGSSPGDKSGARP